MKNLVISNHPTTGQIAGIASCMEKITMYQFHSAVCRVNVHFLIRPLAPL
jgi:hypothetical protein